MRRIPVFIILLVLSGCGERDLSVCKGSAEQIVLLRQIAVVGATKTDFDRCIVSNLGEKYCRALWLDLDGETRNCMAQHGFKFMDGSDYPRCGFLSYGDIDCYRPKWITAFPTWIQALLIAATP